jgi:hypothetical protein
LITQTLNFLGATFRHWEKKNWNFFTKECKNIWKNRQTFKTTKLGERKTLHPNHERYHAFEFAMNL